MSRLRKQVGTVGIWTMASRLLGLVREMLQARMIGAGMEQSAFAFAFCMPNLARRLFGEGALTSAFVPVFKGESEAGRKESAERLARAVCSMVMLLLAFVVLLAWLGIYGYELLFDGGSERLGLTLRLTRTMLPYAVLICGAAFGMGILNSLHRFGAPAFTPCLLNFVWIGTLLGLMFCPGWDKAARVTAISVAVLVAGALQLGFMLWMVRRSGYRLGLTFKGWRDEKTHIVWRNTAIAAIGAGAFQINTFLDQLLAQKASEWAAGVITYADRLLELPIAVIGTAFGTVLLPTFAGHFAKGDMDGAKGAFRQAVRDLLFIMTPAAVGLGVLSWDITHAFYFGGAFDEQATLRVTRALACYSPVVLLLGINKAYDPWFHAQNDMKTPMRITTWLVLVNLSLNVAAVYMLPVEWRHVGIAGATGLSTLVRCVWMGAVAQRRTVSLIDAALVKVFGRMLLCAVVMGGVLLAVRGHVRAVDLPVLSGFAEAACILGMLVALGGGVYFAMAALVFPEGVKKITRKVTRH